MKVCILTLTYGFNLGNRLQNYALQVALEKLGLEVETVQHDSKMIDRDFISDSWWPQCKYWIKVILGCRFWREKNKWLYHRARLFKQFNHTFFHLAPYELKKNRPFPGGVKDQYDYFIIGSDQVWNPLWLEGFEDKYFGTFAPRSKRIVYAGSFGVPEIPQELHSEYREGLNGIPSISVREQRGAEIVRELTGRDVPVVVDPTLLLSKEEWCSIEKKPVWDVPKQYIFNYFLGEMPRKMREDMENQAKREGIPIISAYDLDDPRCGYIGPCEFIYLMRHCKLMYTDSFHGTVFSIIMNKPFYVSKIILKEQVSLNSRIETLLDLFHLQHRFLHAENDYQHGDDAYDVNFSHVKAIQMQEWQHAKKYLAQAMDLRL